MIPVVTWTTVAAFASIAVAGPGVDRVREFLSEGSFLIDVRGRYEHVEDDSPEAANALTLRTRLGYRDVVPAREAVRLATRWLVENPPERGGYEETALQDPFDYAAEDRLAEWWRAAIANPPSNGLLRKESPNDASRRSTPSLHAA